MILLWAIRFFVFKLYESPKYLMGSGRDEEAVAVVHKVAAYNGKTSNLTVEHLKSQESAGGRQVDTSVGAAVQRKLSVFSGNHVRPLFATRKLAYSTSLLIILWGNIDAHFEISLFLIHVVPQLSLDLLSLCEFKYSYSAIFLDLDS